MFIPRHPVVENQFCQFTSQTDSTGGVGGVLAYAGAVCYLVHAASNQDAIVNIYTDTAPADNGGQRDPFGFLMQKVKLGYHQVHPAGFMMPGDLGSSDVVAMPSYDADGAINGSKKAPVGVAHLGIWDTVHYTVDTSGTDYFHPGEKLYVASGAGNAGGKVTNGSTLANVTTQVAKVVKGASAAQVQANINNTTLYPIRIKLVI